MSVTGRIYCERFALGEAQARVAEVVYSMLEPGGALEVTES